MPRSAGPLLALALAGLTATLAVTLPRGVDSPDYRLTELATATPVGVPVGLVTTVIALWLVVRGPRGRRRVAAALITSAAAVLLAFQVGWLAPWYLGPVPSAEPGRPLVVLAQNLEYGRPADLAAVAASAKADIIVLSDLSSSQRTAVLASTLMRDYPHTVGIDGKDHSGVAILSTDPITAATTLDENTNARVVRVQTERLGAVDVLAFHPPPPYQGIGWQAAFSSATEYVADRSRSHPGVPLIVAGDLNATPDNLLLRRLLDAGLRDAAEEVNGGYQPTWPASGSRHIGPFAVPPLAPIDHILVDRRLAVTEATTTATPGADHKGVLASLRPAGAQ